MKSIFRILITLAWMVSAVYTAGATTKPVAAAGEPYNCFPTCSISDGRFLALSGSGLATLAGDTQSIEFAVPAAMTSFEIGVFDGDTGGYWDLAAIPSRYTLYADPMGDGQGSVVVGQWLGSSMLDNDWFNLPISTDARAQTPSGNYYYHLLVENTNPAVLSHNSFKVRSNVRVSMQPVAFAFVGALYNTKDFYVIYPNMPSLSGTTYDGTWDIYLDVPNASADFSVWDGDLDYGSHDCTLNDSDDPDTSNTGIPAWAVGTSTLPEGVATSTLACKNDAGGVISGPGGQVYATGNPADDNWGTSFTRAPSINYDVILPDGTVFHNDNPSGNQEWEQFKISSDPSAVPAQADAYHAGSLPSGVYQIHMDGVDLHNLNAWRFTYRTLGVCDTTGDPSCMPDPLPFRIGDTVWMDANRNGVQDAGEPGIANVTVKLLDADGTLLRTTLSDANGMYSFEVENGTYSVQVVEDGVLTGLTSTTGNLITHTVLNENVLTYDFGYFQPASVADFVWKDLNGNGIQDAGEPGIAGVTVKLLDANGVVIAGASAVTDASGKYEIGNLIPGTYKVQFVLPSGSVFTSPHLGGNDARDSDASVTTGISDAFTLALGQHNTTLDAGLRSSTNLCTYIGSPGFWKNYSAHMTAATFQAILNATPNYKGKTVAQAVAILSNNSSPNAKFLLSAELNATWNGNVNQPGIGGGMMTGLYYYGSSSLNGQTVYKILTDAYANLTRLTADQVTAINYLGSGGETSCARNCYLQP